MRLVFFLVFLSFQLQAQSVFEFKGQAKKDDGSIAYDETHRITMNADKKIISTETTYFKAGKKIAYLFNSYLAHPYVATHKFEDYRFGYSYGLKKENKKWVMYNQEKGEEPELEEFSIKSNSIASQGFNAYLGGKFSQVKDKEVFDFILPGKLTRVDFKVNKEKLGNNLRFTLEADSFFIRLLAPKMIIDYSSDGRIRLYKGPSNLPDENEKSQKVVITYEYPDEVKTAKR